MGELNCSTDVYQRRSLFSCLISLTWRLPGLKVFLLTLIQSRGWSTWQPKSRRRAPWLRVQPQAPSRLSLRQPH